MIYFLRTNFVHYLKHRILKRLPKKRLLNKQRLLKIYSVFGVVARDVQRRKQSVLVRLPK
jgi:hypothetical protein